MAWSVSGLIGWLVDCWDRLVGMSVAWYECLVVRWFVGRLVRSLVGSWVGLDLALRCRV